MELVDELALFQDQAWDDAPAAWFESRGLSHSTVDRFGLGYTGTWGDLGALGDFRGCIVFPYEDGMGRVRKLRFRPIRSGYEGPKYLDFKGAQPHLFAVRGADNPTVHIAEGEPDTMTVWQVGLRAVGIPGANMFKEHWKYLFRPPHVERVVLVLDPDKSGKTAAIRLYGWLKDIVEEVLTVRLPRGLDVNATYMKYGADVLREAIDL